MARCARVPARVSDPLQVSGGAHPRYGRNLGTAEPFATSTRPQASDRTLFHDAQHPSAVWLPVHS